VSIPVDVTDLARALADHDAGYLLSVSGAGTVKVVTVEPAVTAGRIRIAAPGRGTLANLGANPAVTVVFPPREHHGFTLLIDGTATADGDDVAVTPTGAVLHRPAAHADGPPAPAHLGDSSTGCGDDCHPVR
jgi:hypothetical protein